VQIRGGEGSGDAGPRTYVFRTAAGEERSYQPEQVARIYLGLYPFAAAVQSDVAAAPQVPAGAISRPRFLWLGRDRPDRSQGRPGLVHHLG
ncbi:MAG: hypothetical protein Q8L75_20560, partial [Acidobacteriota bacterium]|nr:hypothetical protein [Acidobacteriota bacterium]